MKVGVVYFLRAIKDQHNEQTSRRDFLIWLSKIRSYGQCEITNNH